MIIYLVDYENTKNLTGIKDLSSDDRVIIFYSEKAKTLSFDTHQEIVSSNATIEYQCVEVGGTNALDFQLSSYLGFLIKQNENLECKFYIVSSDKGYSHVCSFWKKQRSIDIGLLSDLTGKPQAVSAEKPKVVTKPQAKASAKNPNIKGEIKNSLQNPHIGLTEKEIQDVVEITTKYKTPSAINTNLNKLLKDSAKAGEILKLIKPILNQKK